MTKMRKIMLCLSCAVATAACIPALRDFSLEELAVTVPLPYGATLNVTETVRDFLPTVATETLKLMSQTNDSLMENAQVFPSGGNIYVTVPSPADTNTVPDSHETAFTFDGYHHDQSRVRVIVHLVFTSVSFEADVAVPAGNYSFSQIQTILDGASDLNHDGQIVVQFMNGVNAAKLNSENAIMIPNSMEQFVVIAQKGDTASFTNSGLFEVGRDRASIFVAKDRASPFSVKGLVLTLGGGGGSYSAGAAIYLSGSHANYVVDNTINVRGIQMAGVQAEDARIETVSRNVISYLGGSQGWAIHVLGDGLMSHLSNNQITILGSSTIGLRSFGSAEMKFVVDNSLSVAGSGGNTGIQFGSNGTVGILSGTTIDVTAPNSTGLSFWGGTAIDHLRYSTIKVSGSNAKAIYMEAGTPGNPTGIGEILDVELQKGGTGTATGISMLGSIGFAIYPGAYSMLNVCELSGASSWSPYLDTTAASYFSGADINLGGDCLH